MDVTALSTEIHGYSKSTDGDFGTEVNIDKGKALAETVGQRRFWDSEKEYIEILGQMESVNGDSGTEGKH